jgi:hypothetical protein
MTCRRASPPAPPARFQGSSGPANASTTAISKARRSNSNSQYFSCRLRLRCTSAASISISEEKRRLSSVSRANRCSHSGNAMPRRPMRKAGASHMVLPYRRFCRKVR